MLLTPRRDHSSMLIVAQKSTINRAQPGSFPAVELACKPSEEAASSWDNTGGGVLDALKASNGRAETRESQGQRPRLALVVGEEWRDQEQLQRPASLTAKVSSHFRLALGRPSKSFTSALTGLESPVWSGDLRGTGRPLPWNKS